MWCRPSSLEDSQPASPHLQRHLLNVSWWHSPSFSYVFFLMSEVFSNRSPSLHCSLWSSCHAHPKQWLLLLLAAAAAANDDDEAKCQIGRGGARDQFRRSGGNISLSLCGKYPLWFKAQAEYSFSWTEHLLSYLLDGWIFVQNNFFVQMVLFNLEFFKLELRFHPLSQPE